MTIPNRMTLTGMEANRQAGRFLLCMIRSAVLCCACAVRCKTLAAKRVEIDGEERRDTLQC